MRGRKITQILIEVDNEKFVKLSELNKEQYEHFLEVTHQLRCFYMTSMKEQESDIVECCSICHNELVEKDCIRCK